MNSEYPIEALLRPAVELQAGIVCVIAAATSLIAPSYFWMTPEVSYFGGGIFSIIGYRYLKDYFYIKKYQTGLWKLARFSIDPKDIPVTEDRIWLGKGFRWKPIHTQRYYDLANGRGEKYTIPTTGYNVARAIEKTLENNGLPMLAKLIHDDHPFNPYPWLPVDSSHEFNPGGSPFLHSVEPEESDVHMPLSNRNAHVLVLGTTRVGKTRGAEVIVTQDIHRGAIKGSKSFGNAVIMIDPKGDLDLCLRMFNEAKRAGRAEKFVFIHLGHSEYSARYNPVGDFNRITELATRTTNGMSGDGDNAVFKDFAWRFLNIVAQACARMGKKFSYDVAKYYMTDLDKLLSDYVGAIFSDNENVMAAILMMAEEIDERKLNPSQKSRSKKTLATIAYLSDCPDELKPIIESDGIIQNLMQAVQYDRSYYDKITASLLPYLDKLTSGSAGKLLSPDYFDESDTRPIIDIRRLVREGCVVYIGGDAMADPLVASSFSNAFLSDLLSYSAEIYTHGTESGTPTNGNSKAEICLHIDEMNEVISPIETPALVNKAGGSGVWVTGYTQTIADIEVKLGDKAKAEQIIGNFNTILMFRVRGTETAKVITENLPEVEVTHVTNDSGYTDGMGPDGGEVQFSSSNKARITTQPVKLIAEHAPTELPKGQCFAVINGSQIYKLRLPLFEPEDNVCTTLLEMISAMEDAYGYRFKEAS